MHGQQTRPPEIGDAFTHLEIIDRDTGERERIRLEDPNAMASIDRAAYSLGLSFSEACLKLGQGETLEGFGFARCLIAEGVLERKEGMLSEYAEAFSGLLIEYRYAEAGKILDAVSGAAAVDVVLESLFSSDRIVSDREFAEFAAFRKAI